MRHTVFTPTADEVPYITRDWPDSSLTAYRALDGRFICSVPIVNAMDSPTPPAPSPKPQPHQPHAKPAYTILQRYGNYDKVRHRRHGVIPVFYDEPHRRDHVQYYYTRVEKSIHVTLIEHDCSHRFKEQAPVIGMRGTPCDGCLEYVFFHEVTHCSC